MDGHQHVTILLIEDDPGHALLIEKNLHNPHEVKRCYELGCNIYITKPVEYEQFSGAIRTRGLFLSIVKVPEKE